MTGRLHQVTLANFPQATQPTPTAAPRLTNMREAPFHFLATEPLQPLAAPPAHAASLVAVGTLPLRGLVRPDTIVRTLLLRDVGPQPCRRTVRQRLGLVLTLIGRHLFQGRQLRNGLLGVGCQCCQCQAALRLHPVDLGCDHTFQQGRTIRLIGGVDTSRQD